MNITSCLRRFGANSSTIKRQLAQNPFLHEITLKSAKVSLFDVLNETKLLLMQNPIVKSCLQTNHIKKLALK